MPVTGDGRRVVDICPKANSTPPPRAPDKQGVRAFIGRVGVRGNTQKHHSHL